MACLGGAGVLFAASADTEPVGLAGGMVPADEPGTVELVSMWVAPSVRGRRIGGLLVDAVIDWAHDRGASSVRLEVAAGNEAALRAYARQGFRVTARPAIVSGCSSMELTLEDSRRI